MNYFRSLLLTCVFVVFSAGSALAEGFSMSEWSARGLSLAGGMVGRADDPSAVAYNPAGITQLAGTQFMAGASIIMPYGNVHLNTGQGSTGNTYNTAVEPEYWVAPHGYVTYQLNDDWWFGAGIYSRFGLGNRYSGSFPGAGNMYDVGLKTLSFVPVLAYKVNNHLSLAVGVEAMYMHLYEGVKIPTIGSIPDLLARNMTSNDMQVEATSMGFGAHVAAHLKLNEQWAMGLVYKSQVIQNASGDASFGRQGQNLLISMGGQHLPEAQNTDVHGSIRLPDSIAFGVTYKPLDNLSFEVGTVFYRWSTYNSLDIYFDSGYNAIYPKKWRDSWNFNASVEYKPTAWLALRAGYWYDTSPINEDYAEYMLPTNGRDVITLGAGFTWDNWTLDLAYAHLFIHSLDYNSSKTTGVITYPASPAGISGGNTSNAHTDIFSLSLSYKF